MPAAVAAQTSGSPGRDDLDDLFNYDVNIDDIFNDSGDDSRKTNKQQTRNNAPAKNDNLGIDEEIKISKKRKPIPKLDENLILSAAGIPKLRKISKERLRFKGKGHEFSDVARLLNTYQLWLDDLYPRAKFGDALIMVEKLGHGKRIQMMRKAWIDEGKPRISVDNEDVDEDFNPGPPAKDNARAGSGDRSDSEPATRPPSEDNTSKNSTMEESHANGPDDDELDALLAEENEMRAAKPNTITANEDDLDALFAEDEIGISEPLKKSSDKASFPEKASADEDRFADEMEAMADMDDLW